MVPIRMCHPKNASKTRNGSEENYFNWPVQFLQVFNRQEFCCLFFFLFGFLSRGKKMGIKTNARHVSNMTCIPAAVERRFIDRQYRSFTLTWTSNSLTIVHMQNAFDGVVFSETVLSGAVRFTNNYPVSVHVKSLEEELLTPSA